LEPHQHTSGATRIHRRTLLTYLGAYLIAISITIRGVSVSLGHPYQWTIAGLLLVFLALLVVEPWLSRGSRVHAHVCLAAQAAAVSSLLYLSPKVDFFAALFLVLSLQAAHVFPGWIGFVWLGVYAAITTVSMVRYFGWTEGLPYILSYAIAYLIVGSFVVLLRQSEPA
jgi:hypothetical protein